MDLENLLLGLLDSVRTNRTDGTTAAGTLASLFGISNAAGAKVTDVITGGGSGVLGGLVGGRGTGIGSALPLLGLLGLVNDGQTETSPVPDRFELPTPIAANLALDTNTGSLAPITYGDRGTVRLATPAAAPQIQINVSALDSRSFVDRSDEIADAVRSAMLRSHSLSDVLVEE